MTRRPAAHTAGLVDVGPLILEILVRPSRNRLRTIVVSLMQVLLAAALLPLLVSLIHLIVVGLIQYVARTGAALGAVLVLGALLAFLWHYE